MLLKALTRLTILLASSGAAANGLQGTPDAASAIAQPVAPRDVSALIGPIREKHAIPGMVGLVTTGDAIVARGVSGKRAADSDEPVTIDDKFHLGSCTKSMTATLVAILVQERTLKWETTVGESFPELLPTMHEQWKTVTLEQLLTNHGGAPHGLDADGLWRRLWNHKGTKPEQRMSLVEAVVAKTPEAAPGTKYIYSNAGFAIAGAIAEKKLGRAWEDLITEKLFAPLGMTSAGFGAPGSREAVDQPRGHTASKRVMLPGPGSDNPAAIGPAGIVHCSMDDWAKYIRLHIVGDRLSSLGLPVAHDPAFAPVTLDAAAFKRLHTPYMQPDSKLSSYAMGWSVSTRPWAKGEQPGDTGRVLTHSGSNTMWYCVAWIAPEKNFGVMVACNQGGDAANKACDEVAWALIQTYLKVEK